VRRTPDLFIPLVMMALVGTLTYEFQVSLPAISTHTFDGGARTLGLVTASMGVGAVVGGLASAGRSVTGVRVMVVAAVAFGITTVLAALAPTVALEMVALLAVGASSVWFLSLGNSTLQVTAAPEMRGRVMALWAVAFLGSTPIGGPAIGWVAQHAGPRWALAVGGLAALLAAGLGAVALLRRARAAAAVAPAG